MGIACLLGPLKMQANDRSETALKFLRSKNRKNFHFHNKIPHRTQNFVSSNIWSEN